MENSYNNKQCSVCENDCTDEVLSDCKNFKKANPISLYIKIIKEENRNLHKFCDKYNLKYSELMKMLRYKTKFKYKYRKCLEEFLFITGDEWKVWQEEGCKTYGEE